MKTLSLPRESLPYLLLQRTTYMLTARTPFIKRIPIFFRAFIEGFFFPKRISRIFTEEMEREYEEIRRFLPTSLETVLDIGCGIGGIDAMIARDYTPHFTLLDTTQITTKIYYGFEKKGCYYNSLDTTRLFLEKNGVQSDHIHPFDVANKDTAFKTKFDLILSLYSWGFHYPIETYLEDVVGSLKENGVLILDLRKDTRGYEAIKARFPNVRTVSEDKKNIRIAASKT